MSFLPITTGCRTTKNPELLPVVLPPVPVRQYQAMPESKEDFVHLLVYYEALVQEWESWAAAVEKSLPAEAVNEKK